ncbi:hypothetical protein SY88_12435 [Clostridiales bacterium PH28_bin88]|nr:hypothetical protein SY88_12435 [Clostridiales bacterium PH28_bin88]
MRPLDGVRVVGLEHYIAGPYCTMLLADYGAEVIKVEKPGSGDPRRSMSEPARAVGSEVSWMFLEYNRGKKSVALNLKTESGREVLLQLLQKADVLVVNFAPGVMEEIGLGYDEVHRACPRLVYVMISGFGQMPGYRSPLSDQPSFDIVAEAVSGFMSQVGYEDRPPVSAMYALPDLLAGQIAAQGALLGLIERDRTGEGSFVDISMFDVMVSLMERSLIAYAFLGELPAPGREKLVGPRGAFKAKDGYVVLSIPADYLWERLAAFIGRADLVGLPETKDGRARARHNDSLLRPAIEGWMAGKTREEAAREMAEAGIPAGVVRTVDEVYTCEHAAARKLFIPCLSDTAAPKLVRGPLLATYCPPPEYVPAPSLGEHTGEVLAKVLGYSGEQIENLIKGRAVEV